jgi:hypothetical protein
VGRARRAAKGGEHKPSASGAVLGAAYDERRAAVHGPVESQPREGAANGAELRVHESGGGECARLERRATVEREPAKPEQPCTHRTSPHIKSSPVRPSRPRASLVHTPTSHIESIRVESSRARPETRAAQQQQPPPPPQRAYAKHRPRGEPPKLASGRQSGAAVFELSVFSSPAPLAAIGKLCGASASRSASANRARGPSIMALTREAAPAEVWMTMPPASSQTPQLG